MLRSVLRVFFNIYGVNTSSKRSSMPFPMRCRSFSGKAWVYSGVLGINHDNAFELLQRIPKSLKIVQRGKSSRLTQGECGFHTVLHGELSRRSKLFGSISEDSRLLAHWQA